MAAFYSVPQWFLIFAVVMEVLFSFIAISVSFYALRIFRISGEKQIKHFFIGFLLIGISYVIWAITNIFIAAKTAQVIGLINIENIELISALGIYSYILLFAAGLVSLTYATLKMQRGSVYYLMLGLSFLVIVVSFNKIVTFRILSVFLISFIAYQYLLTLRKNNKSSLILTAFILLLTSNINYIFVNHYETFVIGHFLELFAYSLILFNLIKAIKK